MIRIHESHIFVLRKIHFKQMKIITVYTQLKQLCEQVIQVLNSFLLNVKCAGEINKTCQYSKIKSFGDKCNVW